MSKKNQYIYEQPRFNISAQTIIKIVLVLLVIVLIVSIVIFKTRRGEGATLDFFADALEKGNYAEAMVIYDQVQEKASNPEVSQGDRNSIMKQQLEMENFVDAKIDVFLEKLEGGENFTSEDVEKLSQLKFLTSMHVVPKLKSLTEQMLDGEVSVEIWEHYVRNFVDVAHTSRFARDLIEQEESLVARIEDFIRVSELEKGDNWQLTWSAWEELSSEGQESRFVRDYAGFRLLSFQKREYSNLMNLTGQMIKANQYYTALNLLNLMHEVFPERAELTERITFCEEKLPASIQQWKGGVEVLSIRPLIAREELAFANSSEESYARNALITTNEFLSLLRELYANDYVLVSLRQIAAWPDSPVSLMVPNGKKPLILCLDRWQYTVLNQVCGTSSLLYLDENGELIAESGEEVGRNLDAITILEDFIEENPNFSFDGAKAVIALNCRESLFGFTVNEDEVENSKEAWSRIGQVYPDVTEDEFIEHRDKVAGVFTYLQEHGWEFASAGYAGFDTANLNLDELEEEISNWSLLVNQWLENCHIFAFPNGSHVYQNEDSLDFLLNRGWKIFIGQGPKPYHYFQKRYSHFDSIAVNGNALESVNGHLANMVNTSEIIDYTLR